MVTVGAMQHCAKAAISHDLGGMRVLEVGSKDHNGTVRSLFELHGLEEYVGVDLEEGPGVDEVCGVHDLRERFGEGAFDLVVATELVEHVRDWIGAFRNLKAVARVGGTIIVTTRSRGFPYHGYPHDYWRYSLDDMRTIFADQQIGLLEADHSAPGVCITATKRAEDHDHGICLDKVCLYSIVLRRRTVDLGPEMTASLRWKVGIRRAQLEDILATGHAMAHKAFHYARPPLKNPMMMKVGRPRSKDVRQGEYKVFEAPGKPVLIKATPEKPCPHCGFVTSAPYCPQCHCWRWGHWCPNCIDNTTVEPEPGSAY